MYDFRAMRFLTYNLCVCFMILMKIKGMKNLIENFIYIKFDRYKLKDERATKIFTNNSAFSCLMLMKLSGLKKCTGTYDNVKFDNYLLSFLQ